jgi:WhiB family transcriptional regulator, redox-sensing transcriptional regulator
MTTRAASLGQIGQRFGGNPTPGATGKAGYVGALVAPQFHGDLPCRNPAFDPNWWYAPDDDLGLTYRDAEHAAQLCAGCPAVIECGAWAITQGETSGVWGGLLPAERRRMHRANRLRRQPVNHGTGTKGGAA